MDKIEKIRQKIDRMLDDICDADGFVQKKDEPRYDALVEVLDFLDTLSEEPDKSLEEEIENYFQGHWPGTETAEQCNTDLHFTPPAIIRLARHFAEWQKEQMMKNAVECSVYAGKEGGKWIVSYIGNYDSMMKICKSGDKVKIITVKEEKNGQSD